MTPAELLRWTIRPAKAGSAARHLLQTAVQIVLFWGFFLGVLPVAIKYLEQLLGLPGFAFAQQRVVGWSVFALASLLGLSSAWAMSVAGRGTPLPTACATALVASGPYRYVRNPMAVAGLTQGAAIGVVLGSWSVLAYVLAGGLIWNFWVRPIEESDLRERFGEAFLRYHQAVKCWIPRVPGYRQE